MFRWILWVLVLCTSFSITYAMPNVAAVNLKFCDNPDQLKKTLVYEVAPNHPYEICVRLENKNDDIIPIGLSFVEGIYTNDTVDNRACETADKESEFAAHATISETDLLMAPNDVKFEKITLNFPEKQTGSGNYLGCLVIISQLTNKNAPKSNIEIELRRAIFMDVTVNPSLEAWTLIDKTQPENNTSEGGEDDQDYKKKKIWYVLALILLLALIGGIVYKHTEKNKPSKK